MSLSILSYSQLEWSNTLTNFDDATCMCCWPKDRQANDGNGNGATPYDENCVDRDVADITNGIFFANLQAGAMHRPALIQPVDLVYIPRIIIMARVPFIVMDSHGLTMSMKLLHGTRVITCSLCKEHPWYAHVWLVSTMRSNF